MDNNQDSGVRSRKVWRIFRFQERYELADDKKICRKSGLLYTKRFVGIGGGDEAVGYHRQMAMLCNGDGLKSSQLKGLYGELVNMAAEQSHKRRGYLLNAGDRPLTDAQIGRMLNINPQTMGKFLRLFESVSLIEKVEMPDFENINEDAGKNCGAKDSDTDNPAKQPENKGVSGEDRNIPENPKKDRKPLKKRKAAKAAEYKGKRKKKASNGLTAVEDKAKFNGNSAETKVNVQGEGQAQAKEPLPQPSKPSQSDALGGSSAKAGCQSPQSSVDTAIAQQRAGPVHHRGDRTETDMFYARIVFSDLWPRKDPQGEFGIREITSLASKFHECRCRLWNMPDNVKSNFRARALNQAKIIGRRCENKKHKQLKERFGLKIKSDNPGAIWNSLITKISMAKAARCEPAG